MSMGVKCGDVVTVEADGIDETAAIEHMESFFAEHL